MVDPAIDKRQATTNEFKVSEYDQETLQLHTADQPMAPRGIVTEYLQ